MKLTTLLVLILIGASGYLAWKDGYLASIHPLLDPNSGAETEETAEGDEPAEEEEARPEKNKKMAGSSEDSDSKAAKKEAEERAEKEAAELAAQEKELEAERKKAARLAHREKEMADRRAADERRKQQRKEADVLQDQINGLRKKISEGRRKMAVQEAAWTQETIKTREVERQRLRDASDKYLDQMEAQIVALQKRIRELQSF